MNKQKGSAHVFIIAIVILALIGTLGYVFWRNIMNSSIQTTTQSATSKQKTKKPQSEIIQQKNSELNKYVNYARGFEFLFPKRIYGSSECQSVDYRYDNYGNKVPSEVHYGGLDGPVDMTVLEKGNEYIIVQSKAVVQSDPKGSDAEGYIYRACDVVPTTVSLLDEFSHDQFGKKNISIEQRSFVVRGASNKDDAQEVARDIFKDPEGTVTWLKDPNDSDRENGAFRSSKEYVGGFAYKLWYYGEKKEVVYFALGQSVFFEHPDHSGQYYTDLVDSFKFSTD